MQEGIYRIQGTSNQIIYVTGSYMHKHNLLDVCENISLVSPSFNFNFEKISEESKAIVQKDLLMKKKRELDKLKGLKRSERNKKVFLKKSLDI